MKNQIEIFKEYLQSKGQTYWGPEDELNCHCPLGDCDRDSSRGHGHFYMKTNTTQWDCKKKCGSGNIITLAERLRDNGDTYIWDRIQKEKVTVNSKITKLVEKYHSELPDEKRKYLRDVRGWTDEIINKQKIGWINYQGTYWYAIPIKNIEGRYEYFKLREDYNSKENRKTTYSPQKSKQEAQIYDYETLNSSDNNIFIVEGEGDCLLLRSLGLQAITSTHGAKTFKDEWLQYLPKNKTYYICYDTDEAGVSGADKVASKLYYYDIGKIYRINLPLRESTQENPEGNSQKVDITNYFMELGGTTQKLFELAKEYPERISTTNFKTLYAEDIARILSLTIKEDDDNKVITFLAYILTYTDSAQMNIGFYGPSAGGKSHTAIEVSNFFPDDLLKLASASPTAFFHEDGIENKETNTKVLDLSRKIIIFLDMPNSMLLERLRPLLSHDEKILKLKITDKNKGGGNRTKTVEIIGFPTVVFCSANFRIDEQEATRLLLLSPETTQSKLRQSIEQVICKESDNYSFKKSLDSNEERIQLMQRIKAIKQEKISDVIINENDREKIRNYFHANKSFLKPKDQRDMKRVMSFVKAFALLNFFQKRKENSVIFAEDSDIEQAFNVWNKISFCQELGIPPYIYKYYLEVVKPAYLEKNTDEGSIVSSKDIKGVNKRELRKKNKQVYGSLISDRKLRGILQILDDTGLIVLETDPDDKRQTLAYLYEDSEKVEKNNDTGEAAITDKKNSDRGSGEREDESISDQFNF